VAESVGALQVLQAPACLCLVVPLEPSSPRPCVRDLPSLPQLLQVATVKSDPSAQLEAVSDRTMPWHEQGGHLCQLFEQNEGRLVVGHGVLPVEIEARNLDVRDHVACQEDALVFEQQGGVTGGMRPVLDDATALWPVPTGFIESRQDPAELQVVSRRTRLDERAELLLFCRAGGGVLSRGVPLHRRAELVRPKDVVPVGMGRPAEGHRALGAGEPRSDLSQIRGFDGRVYEQHPSIPEVDDRRVGRIPHRGADVDARRDRPEAGCLCHHKDARSFQGSLLRPGQGYDSSSPSPGGSRQRDGGGVAETSGSPLTRGEIVDMVRNQLAEILEVDVSTISESSSFSDDLDADSLALIELVEALEEELSHKVDNFRIDDEDLEDLRTVRDAVDYVSAKLEIA
jgi:acyl carrier protein